MLMSAFAYHEGGLYAESRAAAERYLEFFPADVDAPYAQFLIALSYYDQIVDIGRDQTNAFESLQEMRDIIERYPDSEYAKSAQMKFELALDHLAGKEMEIGRYYLSPRPLHGGDQPLPRRRRGLSDHHPHPRGAAPARRGLPVARPRPRGADRGGDPRPQLPGLDLVRRQLRAADRPRPAAGERRRQLAERDLPPGRARGMAVTPRLMLQALAIRDMALIEAAELRFRPGPQRADRRDRRRQVDPARLPRLRARLADRAPRSAPAPRRARSPPRSRSPTATPRAALLAEAGLPADDELILRRTATADGRRQAWVNDRRVTAETLRALADTLVELHGQHDDRGLLDAARPPRAARRLRRADLAPVRAAWAARADGRPRARRRPRGARGGRPRPRLAGARLGRARRPRPAPRRGAGARRPPPPAARRRADPRGRGPRRRGARTRGRRGRAPRRAAPARGGRAEGRGRARPGARRPRPGARRARRGLARRRAAPPPTSTPTRPSSSASRSGCSRCAASPASTRSPPRRCPRSPTTCAPASRALDDGEAGLGRLEAALAAADAAYAAAAAALTAARARRGPPPRRADGARAEAAEARARDLRHRDRRRATPVRTAATACASPSRPTPAPPPGPLDRIASGGELSRFLLALKVCLSARQPGLTLIFDEIDRGVGGATADAVGRRLQALGEAAQVLVVTHSPQVAARGATTGRSARRSAAAPPAPRSPASAPPERVEEIARMLAGDTITDEARAAARALLDG